MFILGPATVCGKYSNTNYILALFGIVENKDLFKSKLTQQFSNSNAWPDQIHTDILQTITFLGLKNEHYNWAVDL